MTTKIINDLSRLISKYKSYLVEDEVAYFKNISFEIGNFYNLPIIYKPEITNKQS